MAWNCHIALDRLVVMGNGFTKSKLVFPASTVAVEAEKEGKVIYGETEAEGVEGLGKGSAPS